MVYVTQLLALPVVWSGRLHRFQSLVSLLRARTPVFNCMNMGYIFADCCSIASLYHAVAQHTSGVNSSKLPTAGSSRDETLLVSLPDRPFAATAYLSDDVLRSITGGLTAAAVSASRVVGHPANRIYFAVSAGSPKRVAVVRPAFLPFDEAQPPLSEVKYCIRVLVCHSSYLKHLHHAG